MLKISETQSTSAIDFKKILKGTIIAILTTLILLIVFSFILTYTKLQEQTIPLVTIIITAISILIGGTISTYKIKKNGMLTGMIVGLIYIISIYLISSIITKNFSLNIYSIIMIIASIFAGALGGIIGVNKK